jgi:hypothetical protein
MSEYPIQDKQDMFQMIWAKRFFVLSLVLLGIVFSLQGVGIIGFPVTSQQKQIKPIRAGGLLCQEPIWDFGSVDSVKNSRLAHEFILVNESQETVTIQKIHSTCGCMVAEDFDKKLLPGKSTKIKVNVQLPPTPQLFHKNLAVQINSGVLPLDVVGEIAANSSMYCVPAKVNFGIVHQGEIVKRTVQILRYDLSSIEIIKCEGSNAMFGVFDKKTNDQGNVVFINITLKADKCKAGFYTEYILVQTTNKINSDFCIPITVEIREN